MDRANPRNRKTTKREEGAVMLIVMLMLLMVTATATFAAHATATEVRAAGQQRLGMETHEAAQATLLAAMDWVDRMGPQALVHASSATGTTPLNLGTFEPPLASDYNPGNTANSASMSSVRQLGLRLYLSDLSVASGSGSTSTTVAPIGPSSYGANQAHSPLVVVDIYDMYLYQGTMPGQRADGYGQLCNLRATYTARARARTGDPNVTPTGAAAMQEVASDSRGDGVSGPFGL
ncbi:MAG: hypothetical protein U0230_12720 [Polyangiales bacterium]